MTCKDIVDSDWYLLQYPDVLAAGLDASRHFALYGKYEGRHPRLLSSVAAEAALWSGFSSVALTCLAQIANLEDDYEDASYARWALALWYAAKESWRECYAQIFDHGDPPDFISHQLAFPLLRIESSLKIGHMNQASLILSDHIQRFGYNNNLILVEANLLRTVKKSQSSAISGLNKIFSSSGLCEIRTIHSNLPAALDNICGIPNKPTTTNKPAAPLVTVIIPVFNAESSIALSLESILNQTWQNLEVIVVDDFSSDNTIHVVSEVAKRDERVRIIRHDTNLGAYAARNSGLCQASGVFITNHDSDDWSHPERISRCVEALQASSESVAVYTDWVRLDEHLYFKTLDYKNGLIEPTVSSLMFRAKTIEVLGGWDSVRVAADSELLQRIINIWGPNSVDRVLPGTPLVLAMQRANSLTTSPGTHAHTAQSGVRKDYRLLYQRWHKLAASPTGFRLSTTRIERPFPIPDRIASTPLHRSLSYDFVIYFDFATDQCKQSLISDFLTHLIRLNQRIGIFDWPAYGKSISENASPFVLDRIIEGQVSLVSHYEHIETKKLCIIDSRLLKYPPDHLPSTLFDNCQLIEWNELSFFTHALGSTERKLITDSSAIELFRESQIFDSNWYTEIYPDVKAANVDPAWHYLTYGWREGRDPSRHFDSHWYVRTYPGTILDHISPAWHFLSIGRRLGYRCSHSRYTGRRLHDERYPTLVICGHASQSAIFGAERSLVDSIKSFTTFKVNLVVTLPTSENLEYIQIISNFVSDIYIVPTYLQARHTQYWNEEIDHFKKIFIEHQAQIVYVNTIVHQSPAIAATQLGIYCGIHVHESLDEDVDLCKRIGMTPSEIRSVAESNSSIIIPNSNFTATLFKTEKLGRIVPNLPEPTLLADRNDVNTNNIKIALISSNTPKKGLDDFCRLAQNLADMKNVSLSIVGPQNDYTNSLKAFIRHAQIKNLTFIDYCRDSIIALSHANIVLNLSHCLETFGRTILEAMAGSRAVVAYDRGALAELIEHKKTGILIPYLDLDVLASAVRELCDNPELITYYGEAARQFVQQHYSTEVINIQLSKNFPQLELADKIINSQLS